MKFRKKPIVIEAFQMTHSRRWDRQDWPEWLYHAWNLDAREGALFISPDDPEEELLVLGTLEGCHNVDWDDWIIQGIRGELYPCKPDIFEKTYEAVEQSDDEEFNHIDPQDTVL